MTSQAAAVAVKSATAAVKSVSAAETKTKASGIINRFVVAPIMGTLNKVETKATVKVTKVEPATTQWIAEHESKGTDAASDATKKYLHMQKQLLSYRVVRLFEEGRYVFSGQYCKNYSAAKAIEDARFLTQLFFVFLCAVMIGRRAVFSPIAPDSPFAIALDHKVNPNY